MLNFLSLYIEGFCSIVEPVTLNLNSRDITIVRGSNGKGKSSLFSALVWCIYGKSIKGISNVNTWSKVRPKDYTGTYVSVFFESDGKVYKVERCLNYSKPLSDGAKGGSRLLLWTDGSLNTDKGKVNIQSEIESVIGISHRLFISSIMFGQRIKPLISESNSDKRDIFEEAFDLGFISKAQKIAKDRLDDTTDSFNEINTKVLSLSHELDTLREAYRSLRDLEKKFIENRENAISDLNEERLRLTNQLMAKQKEISENNIININRRVDKAISRQREVKKLLSEARGIGNISVEELVNTVSRLIREKKYNLAIKRLERIKKSFRDIERYTDEYELISDRLHKLIDLKNRYSRVETACSELSERIVRLDVKIRKVKEEKQDGSKAKVCKKRISKIKRDIAKLKSRYNSELNMLDNYKWLIKDPLSNTGIKAYLVDSCLERLNSILVGYSSVLGFNIEIAIDLNSARKDFYTSIERGGQVVDYRELSGGEQQLANVAMAFALNELLTNTKEVNIAFLDEVFESLSSENIEVVVSLINSIFEGKTLFLITHHDSLPISSYKTLQVENQEGMSTYRVL